MNGVEGSVAQALSLKVTLLVSICWLAASDRSGKWAWGFGDMIVGGLVPWKADLTVFILSCALLAVRSHG